MCVEEAITLTSVLESHRLRHDRPDLQHGLQEVFGRDVMTSAQEGSENLMLLQGLRAETVEALLQRRGPPFLRR